MSADDLEQARQRIDALDAELQQLIAERARVAQRVREIKSRDGGTQDHYRPSREAEVLRRARERNTGPLGDETVVRLMREIMSACLDLESPLKVAYLGPEGTYTQAAVTKHFGRAVKARAMDAVDEIFRDVECEAASYGVVPIENSVGGMVSHTLDLLAETPLSICGEIWLPVHHHLLSAHAEREAVKHVYAHAQSFAQCRIWLDANLPGAQRVAVNSNGEAARLVSEKGEGAAIASKQTAEIYGLEILASNVEDDPNNRTRFLVIGRQRCEATGADRTSVVMSAQRDQAGALFKLLEPFAEAGLNLTRIESRPSRRGEWDYNFFVDIEGHQDDEAVAGVMAKVRERAGFFRMLGSYPQSAI